jgi:diguanylate cyclase (GGDEF)-like protein
MSPRPVLLVVDDTETNIDILVELLGEVYEIVVALEGETALEIVQEQTIDLILLDIMMPGMDGYEVCRRIKSDAKTQAIPVIFITAKTDEESIEQAYDSGGIDYVTKPFKPKELFARIRTQLQLKRLIEDLELSQKELKHLAETDPMTGLWNRRYFTHTSATLWALARREQSHLSLIMIDIDRFKKVNDTYGHKVGDDVIIALAQILMESIRTSDLACRFGGEEFLILLPETPLEGAAVIAEKIRKRVENHGIELDNRETLHFTVSLGVSQTENLHDPNIEATIQRADNALYAAKNAGRNTLVSFSEFESEFESEFPT